MFSRFIKILLSLLVSGVLFLGPNTIIVGAANKYDKNDYSDQYKSSIYYSKLKEVELTGNFRDDIIAIAESQIGYSEGNSSNQISGTYNGNGNFSEYGRFFSSNGRGWCSEFISWCAIQADIPSIILNSSRSASVKQFKAPYYTWDQTIYSNGTYSPQPGDIALLAWYDTPVNSDMLSHTAMVYKVQTEGSTLRLTVLHGNSNGTVCKSDYTIDKTNGHVNGKGYLVYFVAPNYEATIDTPLPKVPTSLKTSLKSSTSVKLTWQDNNAESYNIYRSTNKNGTYKKITTVEKNDYTDSKLTTGNTYFYKVTSIADGHESAFSETVSVKISISAPTSVKITKAKDNSAKLTWKKSAEIKGYEIYMASSTKSKYTKIKTLNNSRSSYTKSKLSDGKTYYFKIRAYNTINNKKVYSPFSKTAKIKF